MSLEEVDDLCLLAGGVKFRDDKKWKLRHATLRRLSPVANTLHLQLFKDGPKGLQSKASLSLDNFRAMETGFTLDRESNTLALLCDGSAIVLAFDAREALIQWQVKVAASVPYVQQFAAQLLVAPPRRLSAGPARLHVQDLRLSLVMGTPPRLAATWPIADLRRYGPADGKYMLEGGARCGRGEGLHVLGVSAGQTQLLHAAVEEAAQCRLQSRRKLAKRQDESPRGASRHAVSRSCSRDSTLTRSRDAVSYRDSGGGGGLCRQASLQWSTWSSDDCDLEYEPIDGSRANGDGQSEVSVSSSGSESAPRRLRPSVSGQSLRSPRPSRRCGSDCACAIKATRSSLRRTGVLDAGPEAAPQSPVSLPVFVGCLGRFADHVYEEPGERPHSSTDASPRRAGASPPTVVRTVADVHGADPTAAAAYDRPRPGARRLSPDGVSLGADHLYEDPGPADGWYQTPRACACRRAEPLYKQPACGCVACGGRKPAVGAAAPRATAAAAPAAAAAMSAADPTSATMVDRPRVDGSGRMPVLNANTGELELPPQPASDVTLCPRIPSEVILGQGLYSRPERPAYAVIDRNRKTLIPGLAPPPAPQPAPEHQYANTGPQCGDVMANQYVNMTPATAVTSSGDRASKYVSVSPATAVASTGDRASQYVNVMPATVVSPGADQGGAYVNMAPSSVVTSSGDRANQYVNIAPGAAPTSNCDTTHLYTSMAPSAPCSGQPTYANTRPPAVDGSTYVNTPAAARPPSGAGGEYLEMCRRGRFGALRRSRSMDGGRRRALRSLSLGRKPMPSPKPERMRHLAACAVQVAPPTVRCCSTLPGPRSSTMSSDSGVTSCDSMTSSICGDVARLSCSSSEAVPDGRQTPLSAPSESCSSPRGTGSALKPRSGAQYQCVDRSRLLAQMREPEAAGRTVTGADSTCRVNI